MRMSRQLPGHHHHAERPSFISSSSYFVAPRRVASSTACAINIGRPGRLFRAFSLLRARQTLIRVRFADEVGA